MTHRIHTLICCFWSVRGDLPACSGKIGGGERVQLHAAQARDCTGDPEGVQWHHYCNIVPAHRINLTN